MNDYAPIVIFAYNRPHYLRETLNSLYLNEESKYSTLFIFCDGPKLNCTPKELEDVLESRKVAKEKKWCKEVFVIESNVNNGLAKAIISGVNYILDKYESIIVMEDDLVVSKYFLAYMNQGLKKFFDNEKVVSIVGYNYPVDFPFSTNETIFINNSDCLGWATWKRGWALFEEDAKKLIEKIKEQNSIKKFNFDGNYNYFKMLQLVAEKKVNSWAIRWYASTFIHEKLTVFPKKSLVKHIGNQGTNIKVDNSDFFGDQIYQSPILNFEEVVLEDFRNRRIISLHFRKFNRRRLSVSTIRYLYLRFIKVRFKKDY
jgi:hypothetical protein